MQNSFYTIRFSLFTQSFASFRIAECIRTANNQPRLIKPVSKILLFNQSHIRRFILHKTCKQKFLKISIADPVIRKKVKVYLYIEKQLCSIYREKITTNDFSADYEYGLLTLAIELIAGNSLSHIKNDREFDSQLIVHKTLYEHWYYQATCKYRLPTIRIILFIIRLITL